MNSKKFKVINLSIDRKLFDKESAVAKRFKEYGTLFDQLNVIVHTAPGFGSVALAHNVIVHPTNSRTRFGYFSDAYKIAESLFDNDTVVTSQDAFTHRVAMRLKRTLGAKIELQYHTDFMSKEFSRESVKNWLRSLYYKQSLAAADSIRVVSPRIKRSIEGMTSAPIEVLPIYTDKRQIAAAPISMDLHATYPEFDFIFLMASRLEREKNIEMAIGAFAKVRASCPRAGLVVVGDGSQKAKLENAARSSGVEESVKFIGWTENVWSLMKTADCFVLSSNYEGYGLTLAEAALCRAAIVTTDVGIAGDVLKNGEHALVGAVKDGEAMALNMKRLIELPELRKSLAESAKKAIEQFVPAKEEHMRKMKEMLERLA